MRARLNIDKEKTLNNLNGRPKTTIGEGLSSDFESKLEYRKQILDKMKGTKNLLKGINPGFGLSNYNDNFKYI